MSPRVLEKVSAEQLCQQFKELVSSSRNTDAEFERIDGLGNHSASSLIFASSADQLPDSTAIAPAVIVTNEALAKTIDVNTQCVITVPDVRLAQAKIKQYYYDYDASDPEWPDIHPSAVIHESAQLAANVRIGPNSVIGKNVEIGENTQVRANCVIEHHARLGSDCIINNLVNIGHSCVIGNRVILRPGVIVGNEGFGFAQDAQSRYHRIPHTGIVEIQDDVQIGANCNIDRGTYGKTLISRGVKIDALCHIGHNCFIDEDALFVAQCGLAGSCNIGKRVIVSGQTGILDHMSVADDAILLHRAGVVKDIPSSGKWAGKPARPFRDYMRGLSLHKKVEKLAQRLDQLEKKK